MIGSASERQCWCLCLSWGSSLETSCRVRVMGKIVVNTKYIWIRTESISDRHVTCMQIFNILLPQPKKQIYCIYRALKLQETVWISVLIYVNNTLKQKLYNTGFWECVCIIWNHFAYSVIQGFHLFSWSFSTNKITTNINTPLSSLSELQFFPKLLFNCIAIWGDLKAASRAFSM